MTGSSCTETKGKTMIESLILVGERDEEVFLRRDGDFMPRIANDEVRLLLSHLWLLMQEHGITEWSVEYPHRPLNAPPAKAGSADQPPERI